MAKARIYARYREDLPEDVNVYSAVRGFQMLGYDVVPFYGFGDHPTSDDLLTDSCIAGHIGDVMKVLRTLRKPLPALPDYPDHLKHLLGREVYETTLGDVKSKADPCFVKPIQQKLFSGVVWDNSRNTRLHLAIYEDETPVLVSSLVDFAAEYRVFVLDNRILGVRQYRGDWPKTLGSTIVETAVSSGKGKMPRSYAIDFGVTPTGDTLLVEVNDAYALGSYGLNSTQYALMMEARWRELTLEAP